MDLMMHAIIATEEIAVKTAQDWFEVARPGSQQLARPIE
jgi:hypothetical protein